MKPEVSGDWCIPWPSRPPDRPRLLISRLLGSGAKRRLGANLASWHPGAHPGRDGLSAESSLTLTCQRQRQPGHIGGPWLRDLLGTDENGRDLNRRPKRSVRSVTTNQGAYDIRYGPGH